MKKKVVLVFAIFLSFSAFSQSLADFTAPDFTITDIDGNEHNLYSILDEGKPVLLDLFAVWCGPCWNFAQSGALEDFNAAYGPEGNNTAFTLAVESDIRTDVSALSGSGNSVGDWTSIINYPLANAVDAFIARAYRLTYYPTIYLIRPDRTVINIGQGPSGEFTYWTVEALAEEVFGNSSSQSVEGCTDITASNYNALATVDDNSCIYFCNDSVYEYFGGVTGSNMIVMMTGDFMNSLNVQNEDAYIAAVRPNGMVVGSSRVFDMPSQSLAVWGDDIGEWSPDINGALFGETISLYLVDGSKIYSLTEQLTFVAQGTSVIMNEDTPLLLCVAGHTLGCTDPEALNYYSAANMDDGSCEYEQVLSLPEAWSIFSTNLLAENMNIADILSPIEDDVIIVKDHEGMAYIPEWGYNAIVDLQVGQGYQIKLANVNEITIEGLYMKPEENPIELTSGWNMIGYLRLEGADAVLVFEEISSTGNLVIVKDYNGNAYLPDFEYNGIGDILPGQGYRVNINNNDELQYLSNNESYRMSSVEVSENNVSHFSKVAATGNNMTVVIEDAVWDMLPEDGAEIAAFDKAGNIIGSTIYSSPVTVLTVWGDDATTLFKEGADVSEKVSFKVWSSDEVRDFKVKEWAEGSSSYKVDAINRVSSIEMYPMVTDMDMSLGDRGLVKVVNILGQDVNLNTDLSKREILFHVYDDGIVEKVVK